MFPWNIAKSAEAMFSRWALKRVCKFMLKKKLGQFILGDIDLDQLDVQLSQGTIQLSDLALNVDCINMKLGKAASLVVKEGSIGHLLIKMPWSGNGCQVEVNELELVISSCIAKIPTGGDETCSFDDNDNPLKHISTRNEHDAADDAQRSASMDVHEGVKTIAKMVKWLLTSFHVKISNVIVAFDPSMVREESKTVCDKNLVLRITEIECGTSISEDADSTADVFGISHLTNFVKFQGAIIEFLELDNDGNQVSVPHVSGAECNEPFLVSQRAICPIMTGKSSGFGGTIKLSIPGKNGSLDIRKVDADVSIDPIVLRFQPTTIKWLLWLLNSCKNLEDGKDCMNNNSTGSVLSNSAFSCHSSMSVPVTNATNGLLPVHGSTQVDLSSSTQPELLAEALLPGSQLISDWVPLSTDKHYKDGIQDIDFGASMDQFFECFDGMRSFQSALGSSGMWNWTCSVFSAITAASNLASGSLHIPIEQPHVETNLRATFAGISVVLSFCSEESQHSCDSETESVVGFNVDYLGAECNEILFALQVCPQAITVEGTVKHIEITEFLNMGIDIPNSDLQVHNNAKCETALVQYLQAEVIGSLPSSSSLDPDLDSLSGPVAADFPLGNNNGLMKVTLFRTAGVTHCKFTVQSNCANHSLTGTTSFSVNLPPFIFWVIFPVVDLFINLLKEVGKSVEEQNETKQVSPEASEKEVESSLGDDGKRSSGACMKSLSTTEHLRGDVSISSARVILCFPFERGGDHTSFFWWEQFIALDFSSPLPSPLKKGPERSTAVPNARSKKRYTSVAAQYLQLNICDLDMYLITSSNHSGRMSCNSMQSNRFSASCFLSVASRMDCYAIISVSWQEGQVTGSWMAKKARSLAYSEQLRGRDDFVGKDYEFVSASKDLENLKSHTQQELILSSSLLLHFHLPQVMINLSDSQYKGIHCLLTQLMNALVCVNPQAGNDENEFSVSQSSTLMECESLEIVIRPNASESIRSSMQSELPGSWNQLKVGVQKFELLSVTNTGGIKGVDFLRIAHGEGKMWGFITGVPDQEFLLVTCSNSAAKRGDGGGSNALSSRNAGLEIIHLSDQELSHNRMSITVSCGTIVAVGGRLDWFSTISSFFSLPSSDIEESSGDHKSKTEMNGSSTTFVLHLIDIALSYEPYMKSPVVQTGPIHLESGFSHVSEDIGEKCVACLLAASSLTLSNSTMKDSIDSVYRIRLQDIGLLLHVVSEPNSYGTYSVEHLKKIGYVKVARGLSMEAILKINSAAGFPWELKLSKSHVNLETCHDTAASLIHLAAQLQRLFAPDMEESVVHLQNRWENSLPAQKRNNFHNESGNASFGIMASTSHQCPSRESFQEQSCMVGLMDEICDDTFQVRSTDTWQPYASESGVCMPLDGNYVEEASKMNINEPEVISHDLPLTDSVPLIVPESGQASFLLEGYYPEIIEGYILSDLCPLSEPSVGQHSDELCRYRLNNVDGEIEGDSQSGGWYRGDSLKVLENHISKECENFADGMVLSSDSSLHNEACGRVILEKIDLRWRMYGGSDWLDSVAKGPHSDRDKDVSLELALCGMKYQYDIFPDSGVRVSKMSISVQDFHLYDRSRDAPWKLLLTYYHSKVHPRESSSKAFKLDLEAVRPDPLIPLEEYRLNIALLPIKLRLHQSQLDFLINFFGRTSSLSDQPRTHVQESKCSQVLPEKSKDLEHRVIAREALLPYFQKLNIWPILVQVDYCPHHVDLAALRHGKYVELVNFIPWKGIELKLKHVHAAGIYGWGSVCETVMGEWWEDISQNQVHKILQGLPTVRSLISVGAGAAKLVSSPVENYKKERRVLKGVQRGTIAFLRSISLEAVGLAVHLAAGVHEIMLQAECTIASVASPVPRPVKDKSQTDVRSNQPKDAQQGIQQAYESLSDGLGKSAAVLVQNPLKKYQRGAGAGPALAAAVRAVPAAAIAPASACASAAHYALLGVRNSLDPERKKESMEKHCPKELWED